MYSSPDHVKNVVFHYYRQYITYRNVPENMGQQQKQLSLNLQMDRRYKNHFCHLDNINIWCCVTVETDFFQIVRQ